MAERCAPSLQPADEQPLALEGGPKLIEAGYVIAATDYQGLGTAGPHPYLDREVEARNALDSARAARRLDTAHASDRIVVWGHSQGGHAAISTGQLAAGYAPDLKLVAVAAGAPAPDMVELLRANVKTTVGKVLVAMALTSWSEQYPQASLEQIVKPTARPIVRSLGRNCLYAPGQLLASLPGAVALKVGFFSAPPWDTEPWRTIADDNSLPATKIPVPVLLVQSDADTIVPAAVTKAFARRLCASGTTVELDLLKDANHIETSEVAAPSVVKWLGERLAAEPARDTCE